MAISATGTWRVFVAPTRNKVGGFTLLEIMVVLLIIGIMMSMAMVSIGSRGREKAVQEEMVRMKGLFALATQEAVIRMEEWGVRFGLHGYQFLVLDKKNQWHPPVKDERLLKSRYLPDDLRMLVTIEGEEITKDVKVDDPPQLIVSSDGEVTPFQVELGGSDGGSGVVRFRLSGQMNGRIRLERVEKR